MRNRIVAVVLSASLLLGVASCGNDPGTRAVTGGLLGADAGAGIAAVTHGSPATGALIGGGVGAVGGALTSPQPVTGRHHGAGVVATLRRNVRNWLVLIAQAGSICGCGYNSGDRILSGGLIGAGGGTAIAAATCGSPLSGAAVGGGAGALRGALTSGCDTNLGPPVLR